MSTVTRRLELQTRPNQALTSGVSLPSTSHVDYTEEKHFEIPFKN